MSHFAGLIKTLRDRPCIARSERAKPEAQAKPKARNKRRTLYENPFGLTPGQARLMPLIVEGYTAKEIAKALHLSIKTIEAHVVHLRKTMKVRSTLRAAVLWDRWTREQK